MDNSKSRHRQKSKDTPFRRHRSGKRDKEYNTFNNGKSNQSTTDSPSTSQEDTFQRTQRLINSVIGPIAPTRILQGQTVPPLPARVPRSPPAPPQAATQESQTSPIKSDASRSLASASPSTSPQTVNSRKRESDSTEPVDVANSAESIAFALQLVLLENLEIHFGKKCCGCDDLNFYGYRYKCIMCRDYDLCDDCFQERRTSDNHESNHPMLVIANAVDSVREEMLRKLFQMNPDELQAQLNDRTFDGIMCECCKTDPIRGIRLKCDDCLDFDLCWNCYKSESKTYVHDDSHTMIAHLWPVPDYFDLEKVKQADETSKSGFFGKVCKVEYQGQTRAMKTIMPNSNIRLKTFINEIKAYKELRCNSIVKFFGYYAQEDPPKLFLLMEFMSGGTLQDVITEKQRDKSARRKVQWLIAIAKGLKCIHKKGFVHKDIKPDNILLDDHGRVKIGDMGTTVHDDGKNYFRDSLAPRWYAAPEILSGDKFTNKVDMFSFGLLMNELFTYTPYEGKTSNIPIRFAVKTEVLWSLVQSCVSGNPNERPLAAEAADELEKLETGFWTSLVSKSDYMKLDATKKDELFLKYIRAIADD